MTTPRIFEDEHTGETNICLRDMNDWDSFAADNFDTLVADYGSTEQAYTHAVQGGLRFGGGAAAIFNVYFAN